MSIREANKHDVDTLAELVGSLAHFYLEDRSKPLPRWLADTIQPASFKSRIESPDYLNLVYEEAGLIQGYISIKSGSHLYHLFVREVAQGKGIARQLWRHAKAVNPQSHQFTVRSSLFAVPVYLRFGFHKVGSAGYKDGIGFQPMAFGCVDSSPT